MNSIRIMLVQYTPGKKHNYHGQNVSSLNSVRYMKKRLIEADKLYFMHCITVTISITVHNSPYLHYFKLLQQNC